jgi:hypothetical protein
VIIPPWLILPPLPFPFPSRCRLRDPLPFPLPFPAPLLIESPPVPFPFDPIIPDLLLGGTGIQFMYGLGSISGSRKIRLEALLWDSVPLPSSCRCLASLDAWWESPTRLCRVLRLSDCCLERRSDALSSTSLSPSSDSDNSYLSTKLSCNCG